MAQDIVLEDVHTKWIMSANLNVSTVVEFTFIQKQYFNSTGALCVFFCILFKIAYNSLLVFVLKFLRPIDRLGVAVAIWILTQSPPS